MAERSRFELARRAFATLRDEGVVALLDRLGPHLGVRRLLLVEQRPNAGATARALPAGHTFDEASLGDLDGLAELRGAEHERSARALGEPLVPVRELHRQQFESGHRCFVVRQGERIVATDWIARGVVRVPFLACELVLAANEAYAYDAFVAHELRGRGIGQALYAWVATRLAREGVGRILGLARVANRANRQATAKAGFRAAGSLTCLALAGRTLRFGDARVAHRPFGRTSSRG